MGLEGMGGGRGEGEREREILNLKTVLRIAIYSLCLNPLDDVSEGDEVR